ncbi:unnamed protein product [Prunus armeniaca]|uniref:Uncharacterized protein n=1 Tax=Prunus armeniaca TaxID=36596 RepID=A0A6J5UPN0_PRUAR|nr:unnamed protein product [Prunus armeniaca]
MACNHFYGSAAHTVCSLGIKVKMEINVTVLYQIKKEIPMLRLIKLVRVHREQALSVHYRQIVEAYRKLDYD